MVVWCLFGVDVEGSEGRELLPSDGKRTTREGDQVRILESRLVVHAPRKVMDN